MPDTMQVQTIEVDGVTKYAIAFGLTDENGQPLLDRNNQQRMVNLVGESIEDVTRKLANSMLEVSRKLERANRRLNTLRDRKPTAAAPAVEIKPRGMTDEERTQIGLDIQDPRRAAEAVEKVVQSTVPVAQITGEITRQGQEVELGKRRQIAAQFIGDHRGDYDPCEANGVMMNDYLKANGLEYSRDNLERAFAALEQALVPVRPNASPANAAPPNVDANARPDSGNRPPSTPPAPTGGIRSSQASALPTNARRLTRQQALEMLYKNPREYERWMANRELNAILTEALAGR